MSIDSIYYLEPIDIALLCLKATSGLLVALHHTFPHAYGSFAAGEAKYIMTSPTTVSMHVAGNGSPYVHSNLHWMRANGFEFEHEGVTCTLVWSPIEMMAYHHITAFRVFPSKLVCHRSVERTFSQTLQDHSYYGPSSISTGINDKADICVPGEMLSLTNLTFHSWGPFVFLSSIGRNIDFIAPKGLVTDVAMYCMGRKRSSDNYKTALSYARTAVRRYNLPADIIASSAFAAATLGFVLHMEFEMAVMHSVLKPVQKINAVHSDALDHKFRAVVNWKRVITAAVAAAGMVATAVTAATVPSVAPIVACAALATTIAANGTSPPPTVDGFENYRIDRSSMPPADRLIHHKGPIVLPSTKPARSVDCLMSAAIDPSATINVPDIQAVSFQPRPLVAAGIVSTASIPVVPEASAHSSISAIVERKIKVQPASTSEFDPHLFSEFAQWARDNFDDFLPGIRNNVVPAKYQDWNRKFPRGQADVHNRAAVTVNDGVSRYVNNRGAFVKMEGLSKSGVNGVKKVAFRGIEPAEPEHNVCTGPFIMAASDAISSAWNPANEYGLVYASGHDAETLGRYFINSIDSQSDITLEGDFNRYDASIHAGLGRLENDFYYMMGAPEHVLQALERSIQTDAIDKYGISYSVLGTRHSGDPNTSCGNTLLQGLMSTFAMAVQFRNDDMTVPSASWVWRHLRVRGLLMGDDSIFNVSSVLDPVEYTLCLRKIGVDLAPIVRRGIAREYESTFCSSRFYPVDDANGQPTVIMGPPIGRVLTKAGYYASPPPDMDIMQLVRGDALSRKQSSHCIPFLDVYWDRVDQLTRHIRPPKKLTKSMIDHAKYQFHIRDGAKYYPSNDTWCMLEHVYGLTREHYKQWQSKLQRVVSLPCTLDCPMFSRAYKIDSVAPDDHDDLPVVPDDSIVIPPISTTPISKHDHVSRCAGVCPEVVAKPLTYDHVDPGVHFVDVFSDVERPRWSLWRMPPS